MMVMEKKPTRYYVAHIDPKQYKKEVEKHGKDGADPACYWTLTDFDDLEKAREFMLQDESGGAHIMERKHMEVDAYGLWDYDEEYVEGW